MTLPGICLRRARSSSDGVEAPAFQFMRCFPSTSYLLVVIFLYNSTCDEQVRVKGEIKPVQPSFYDDIIRLPDIIEKVPSSSKLLNTLPSRWVWFKKELCVLWRRFSPILALGSFTRTCGSSTKQRLVSGSLSEDPAVLTLMKSSSTIPCWNGRSARFHIHVFARR